MSEWSPFGECSGPCNGTQSRYQTLQGPHCTRNDTNVETRPCSSGPTTYQKGCSTCTCLNTTEEHCVTNCAITSETCAQIDDPLFTYAYAQPTNGSCCGECVKVPSKSFYETCINTSFSFLLEPEICSVHKLPAEIVTLDNCVSTALVPQQECLGGCISYAMSGFNSPKNTCRCCAPAETKEMLVEMKCTDSTGSVTTVSKPYQTIISCSCSVCG